MSILWADFPSEQRGLYGTNVANMLAGVYANATTGTELAVDPDGVSGGVVLRLRADGNIPRVRYILPANATTCGVAVRIWMADLPQLAQCYPAFTIFKNNLDQDLFYLCCDRTGRISAFNTAGVKIGSSVNPELTADGWWHVESKIVIDAAVGSIEVKVEGQVALTLTGINTGVVPVSAVTFSTRQPVEAPGTVPEFYLKDVVFWDGAGAYANDFQGSVAVHDLYVNADVSLNWAPSIGALGYPLITDNFPSGTLTVTGAIADGETVRLDNTYYRFTNAGALDAGAPAGTLANPWRTLIGADNAATLLNLYKAIGATGVAGVDYSTALVAHTTVDANGVTATQVSVTAKLVSASAIVTAETGANLAWTSGTLINGPTDPSFISADATPPAAAVFGLTDLPPDVTSIRALIPIFRAQKSDGGDCNVQAGLSPDNAAWVNGADQPLSVAFTFYWTPNHTNPVTAAPWTPGQVNGAFVRVNRTL